MYPPAPQQQDPNTALQRTAQTQLSQGQVAQQQQTLAQQRQAMAQQAEEEQRKRALFPYQEETAQAKAHFFPTVLEQEKGLYNKLINMNPWGTVPGGGPGGGGTPSVSTIPYPDLAPAQQAAFARQKDITGQTTQGALTGLQQALAGRGMLGSGVEAKGTQAILQQGAGQLGNLSREQAIQQTQAAQKAAETAYQGAITQRGQDIQQQIESQRTAVEAWRAQEEALKGLFGSLGLNMNIGY